MNRSAVTKPAYMVERVWNRFHRVAADLPRSRLSSELAFRTDREAYRPFLPGPSEDDLLLTSLRRDGLVMTTADELGMGNVLTAASPLMQEWRALPTPPDLPATHLLPGRLLQAPEIFRWGVSD